jgi:hypothetical protein
MVRQVRYGPRLKAFCRGKTGLLLNVGCGDLPRSGWTNIDFQPGKGRFYLDIVDGLPIADGAVHRIHCEHFLEHLEFDDAVRFLAECYRVLEGGGSLRVIVPDAERYMRAYCDNDGEFFTRLANLGNSSAPLFPKVMVCNQSFRMGGDHHFAWDFETLQYVGSKMGFSSVVRSEHGAEDGQDWWRPVESLYAILRK